MYTNTSEIAEGVFRISIAPTDQFEYNHFLIVDEKCMLIHTGGKKVFPTLHKLIGELIDFEKLQYLAFSHIESDECGSLNEWLAVARNAVPLITPVGKATLCDFSVRAPEVVQDGQVINLGKNKIMVLATPHIPHGWESCLFYETTNGILFSSDLGAQSGINIPVTEENITQKVLDFQKKTGFMPTGENLRHVISGLRKLDIRLLAAMHGSTLKGSQIRNLLDAIDLGSLK
jgi:flavorubredoxin